jgi:hypothetical protein
MIFHEICYWGVWKFVHTFQFWLKLDNSNGHFTCVCAPNEWVGNIQTTLVNMITVGTIFKCTSCSSVSEESHVGVPISFLFIGRIFRRR